MVLKTAFFVCFQKSLRTHGKTPTLQEAAIFLSISQSLAQNAPLKTFKWKSFIFLNQEPHPGTYQRLLLEGFHTSSYPSKWRLAANAGSSKERPPAWNVASYVGHLQSRRWPHAPRLPVAATLTTITWDSNRPLQGRSFGKSSLTQKEGDFLLMGIKDRSQEGSILGGLANPGALGTSNREGKMSKNPKHPGSKPPIHGVILLQIGCWPFFSQGKMAGKKHQSSRIDKQKCWLSDWGELDDWMVSVTGCSCLSDYMYPKDYTINVWYIYLHLPNNLKPFM